MAAKIEPYFSVKNALTKSLSTVSIFLQTQIASSMFKASSISGCIGMSTLTTGDIISSFINSTFYRQM